MDLKTWCAGMDSSLKSFKDAHNRRMDDMENSIGRIEARVNRPGAASRETNTEQAEYEKVYNAYLRKGAEAGLREAAISAAVTSGSDPDGGYAVPSVIDSIVSRTMANVNPLRQIANVIQIGTPNYRKLYSTGGAASGWVGETEARPETTSPSLAALTPYMGELYANPAATQESLDDIFFDVEAWLGTEIGMSFAEYEGSAFVSGDGVKKPKGFLAYGASEVADGARALGTLQYLKTGKADGFIVATAEVSPADCLVDLVQSVKASHRSGAVWLMNKATLGIVRKFKYAIDGQFIWAPGTAAGLPSALLGYPVYECEDMPNVGPDAFPIAFGNFRNGYTIADRMGARVLRDPYTNKPYVHFYTTKRTGGMVTDSEAIKLLKVAL